MTFSLAHVSFLKIWVAAFHQNNFIEHFKFVEIASYAKNNIGFERIRQ